MEATTAALCACGVPVFQGNDGICNSCVRRHRADLLKAAKPVARVLDRAEGYAGLLSPEYPFRIKRKPLDVLRKAIAKAEGSAD